MSDFKYEVGDKFIFDCNEEKYGREITYRYTSSDDSKRYIVKYEEASGEYPSTEWFVDDHYTKIEPFFEVGKKYRSKATSEIWTCEAVGEMGGSPRAWIKSEYEFRTVYAFSNYEEVK